MNYEDMFIPVDGNEDLFFSDDYNKKNSVNDFKLANKHFHRINKRINTKLGTKKVVIEYYSSGPINTTITHAISGVKQIGFQVGTIYEDLFFKVTLTTSSQPLTLFYYSPEEYEKHHYTTLSDDLKSAWRQKNLKATLLIKSRE
jgi:hypothetical protein